MAQILLSTMLVCFGVSWPISIIRTLRAKRVDGKSLLFLILIFTGYIAGTLSEIVNAPGEMPRLIILLYLLNLTTVGIDMLLYLHYKKHPGGRRRMAETHLS